MQNAKYFINNPIFVKIKKHFSLKKLSFISRIERALVNERIVEIPFVLNSLPGKKDVELLDLGCSESPLAMFCASLGYKTIGIDGRDYPYYHPNFRFIKADLTSLPLADQSIDVAIAISTLEHIGLGFYQDKTKPSGDQQTVDEVYRILKPQGLFLISVPFGCAQQTTQQRIYNYAALSKLLKNFRIETEMFYQNQTLDPNFTNYWQNTPKEKLANFNCNGKTQAVALIKARKK